MDYDIKLNIQNRPDIKSVRRHIKNEIAQLDEQFEGIENCRVSLDLPYHHRYPGNIYNFEIEVFTPEEKIKVRREPSANAEEKNIYALIREAFDDVHHKLRNCACEKITSTGHDGAGSPKNVKRLYERVSRPPIIKSNIGVV